MRRALSKLCRGKPPSEEHPRLEPILAVRKGPSLYPNIGVVDFSLTTTKVIPARPAAVTSQGDAQHPNARLAWEQERRDDVSVTELRMSPNKPPIAIIMEEEDVYHQDQQRKSRGHRRTVRHGGGTVASPRS
mmetsp:Transcript_20457/g.39685  ORF Transcript_20457/g.39685 Transcript_20457/m.39685 type:complete len:132 (+) Transcript_20457:241-636(+)